MALHDMKFLVVREISKLSLLLAERCEEVLWEREHGVRGFNVGLLGEGHMATHA